MYSDRKALEDELNVMMDNSWIVDRCNLMEKNGFRFTVGNESQTGYKNPKLFGGYTYNVTVVVRNTYQNYSRQRNETLSCMLLPPETSGLIYLWLLLLIPIIVICGVLLRLVQNTFSSYLCFLFM